jgi:hypothetical protein
MLLLVSLTSKKGIFLPPTRNCTETHITEPAPDKALSASDGAITGGQGYGFGELLRLAKKL